MPVREKQRGVFANARGPRELNPVFVCILRIKSILLVGQTTLPRTLTITIGNQTGHQREMRALRLNKIFLASFN